MESEKFILRQPVGRIMSKLGKISLEKAQEQLTHLDINRSFYPLMLIDSHRGMTQQELADMLLVDKVQVVRIIDYLSKNGYVKRILNPDDRRKYQLSVTEKAEHVMPQIKAVIHEVMKETFQGFTPQQVNSLYDMLYKMEINLKG